MANELIAWDDKFLIGEETIDAQHKELVRLTNEFYDGVQMGGLLAKVFFMQTVKGAVHYIKTHFVTEEGIMEKADYPFLEEHKKQHEAFVNEVAVQIKAIETRDNPDSASFVKFLMNWVLNHIAHSDKGFSAYLEKMPGKSKSA